MNGTPLANDHYQSAPTEPSHPIPTLPQTTAEPPTPTPASEPAQALPDTTSEQPASTTTEATLRLLLGIALEGADQFAMRVHRWERAARQAEPLPSRQETATDLRRYAAIGMLGDMRAQFNEMALSLWDIADEITYEVGFDIWMGVFYSLERWPFSILWPMVVESLAEFKEVRREFEKEAGSWVTRGRSQEQQGRQLARQAVESLMDETLDYVAKNPEVRDLIEQQSVGMAEAAVGTVRERAASADTQIEHLVRSILRRTPGAQHARR